MAGHKKGFVELEHSFVHIRLALALGLSSQPLNVVSFGGNPKLLALLLLRADLGNPYLLGKESEIAEV